MKIAEVWGTTQVEVELKDEDWLKADNTYHDLSRRKVVHGHQNLVCLMTDEERKSAWRDGVQYEFFPADPVPSPRTGSQSEEMLSFLRTWRPDILLLHSANRIQTLLCLRERLPRTHYILYSNSTATTGIVLDEIARYHDMVSACLFKARIIRDQFCARTGYPIKRTRVFPSGIDLNKFKPALVEKDLDCVWVGFLRENNYRKKNVAMLMEVFLNLDGRLYIVGMGRMESKLRQMAPANVTFLGFIERNQLPKVLVRCKVCVHPSLFDPCPRAVSEALACGLPVIGLKEGVGTEDQILDAVNGYRVETPAEMRTVIQKMLTDETLRRQMGQGARKIAETCFNIDVIAEESERFLEEVVNS